MVVSNIFCFYPFIREMIQCDEHIFSNGLKPPASLSRSIKFYQLSGFLPIVKGLMTYLRQVAGGKGNLLEKNGSWVWHKNQPHVGKIYHFSHGWYGVDL